MALSQAKEGIDAAAAYLIQDDESLTRHVPYPSDKTSRREGPAHALIASLKVVLPQPNGLQFCEFPIVSLQHEIGTLAHNPVTQCKTRSGQRAPQL